MESRQKILELVTRFEEIPAGHEDALRAWIVDLRFTLDQVFGSDSQYIQYLKYIKFRPAVVFVTEKERERSWKEGIAQVDNLLRVILNDPKVSDRIMFDPELLDDHEGSSSEDTVRKSLEEFKESAARQMYPLLQGDGPIQEPLRIDSVMMPGATDRKIFKEEGEAVQHGNLQGLVKVLFVTGSDHEVNAQLTSFLNELPAQIIVIPKPVGQETLIDRLNKCTVAEFVIFVLSADFHIYSRTQRPVDGGRMASQEAIFQLGYLTAKFDRQRIVVLYEESEDFLRPTEFFDLFYVPITPSGAWKAEVIRRMKGHLAVAAGLGMTVDDQPKEGS